MSGSRGGGGCWVATLALAGLAVGASSPIRGLPAFGSFAFGEFNITCSREGTVRNGESPEGAGPPRLPLFLVLPDLTHPKPHHLLQGERVLQAMVSGGDDAEHKLQGEPSEGAMPMGIQWQRGESAPRRTLVVLQACMLHVEPQLGGVSPENATAAIILQLHPVHGVLLFARL
jgi:hypothetical protein